jgi:hypothetical protein
MLDEDVSAG